MAEHQRPRSSVSTCVGPCGQSEQVARCPAVILRGLSDQAVAIRCLSVDKHTHTHTRMPVHTCIPSCCRSAWSVERRADECSPRHGPTGREVEGVWTDVAAASPHLHLQGKVGVFNPPLQPPLLLKQPGGNTNRPGSDTPRVRSAEANDAFEMLLICFFHVADGSRIPEGRHGRCSMKELSIKNPASTTEAGKEFNSATLFHLPSLTVDMESLKQFFFCSLIYSALACSRQGEEKKEVWRQTKKMETGLMDRKRQNLRLERESEGPTAGSNGPREERVIVFMD